MRTAEAMPVMGRRKSTERWRPTTELRRRPCATPKATSCSGIAESDRDISPFDHREDIAGVSPYKVRVPTGPKNATEKLEGAVVAFRAVPGMTAEWFQRIVDCHLTRNATAGFSVPEMPYCPLNVKGVRAKVGSTGNGFAVTVESDDSSAAQEVLRRAQSLTGK
jgi:hypothetical protein